VRTAASDAGGWICADRRLQRRGMARENRTASHRSCGRGDAEALLRSPRIDRWAYMTERKPIRAVLGEGLARGTAETINRANEIIGFLASIGETSYLDLVRPAAE
jgi:hypothetical protein